MFDIIFLACHRKHLFLLHNDVSPSALQTRMMRLRPTPDAQYTGAFSALRHIAQKEGVGALFRGAGVVALGAGPAHALYFSAYEHAKLLLGVHDDPGRLPLETGLPT